MPVAKPIEAKAVDPYYVGELVDIVPSATSYPYYNGRTKGLEIRTLKDGSGMYSIWKHDKCDYDYCYTGDFVKHVDPKSALAKAAEVVKAIFVPKQDTEIVTIDKPVKQTKYIVVESMQDIKI